MPTFPINRALVANATANILETWKFRYAPYRAAVRIGLITTGAAGSVQVRGTIGTTEVISEGPVTVGGTAGVLPAPLTVAFHEFIAEQGDLIECNVRETAGATPSLMGFVAIDPI